MVRLLARVIGIGIETADMLVREILSRKLRERRAVARYAKLMEFRTEPRTHDKFKMRPLSNSIVAQDHIRSEFFSKLLEKGPAGLHPPRLHGGPFRDAGQQNPGCFK